MKRVKLLILASLAFFFIIMPVRKVISSGLQCPPIQLALLDYLWSKTKPQPAPPAPLQISDKISTLEGSLTALQRKKEAMRTQEQELTRQLNMIEKAQKSAQTASQKAEVENLLKNYQSRASEFEYNQAKTLLNDEFEQELVRDIENLKNRQRMGLAAPSFKITTPQPKPQPSMYESIRDSLATLRYTLKNTPPYAQAAKKVSWLLVGPQPKKALNSTRAAGRSRLALSAMVGLAASGYLTQKYSNFGAYLRLEDPEFLNRLKDKK